MRQANQLEGKNDSVPDIEGLRWNGGSGPGLLIRYETLIAETHLFTFPGLLNYKPLAHQRDGVVSAWYLS